MKSKTCPHLGVLGPDQTQRIARDYPSFENCCFTEPSPQNGTLLLADQATYCISGGYHQCPRFQTVSLRAGASDVKDPQYISLIKTATTSLPLDSEYLTDSYDVAEDENELPVGDEDVRRPVWLLAGTAFLTVFLLGIVLAGYLGWQVVVEGTLASTTASSASSTSGEQVVVVEEEGGSQSVYVLITATSDPSPGNSRLDNGRSGVVEESQPLEVSELAIVSQQTGATAPEVPQAGLQPAQPLQPQRNFPAAVTPTAIVVRGEALQGDATQIASAGSRIIQPEDVSAPGEEAAGQIVAAADNNGVAQSGPPPTPTPIPEINVQVIVPSAPTRRVAPEIPLIPNPLSEQPTETPTATQTWAPPLVFFAPEENILREGKCTMVAWDVQNVRAVYYENIGVDGQGKREECISDKDKTLLLTVVLPDGGTDIYTTTIRFEEPTPTPTPTWTFTPLPNPSPTWTVAPPTPTPLPSPTQVIVRGVRLETAQPQDSVPHGCGAGISCELGLLATNTGEDIDGISIVIDERSQANWPILLCRQDGVCSAEKLVLTNVGAANTAFVTLRVEAPAAAAGQTVAVRLFASSQSSGDTVRSEPLTLQIAIQ